MRELPMTGLIRWAYEHALGIALAVTWATSALLQRSETPALGAEIAAVLLLIPLTFWATSRHHLSPSRSVLLVLACLPVGHMFWVSITSSDPAAALLGAPPHWQGWMLWAAALGWFITTLVGSERTDLGQIARVLAFLGFACAIWGLAEVVNLIKPYDRLIGSGMALFDNPLSLGQALTLTIAASLSMAARKNAARWVRIGYAAMAATQFIAILAIGARGAMVGVLMGIVAFGVAETGKSRARRAAFVTASILAMTFLIAFALIAAAWTGALGPSAYAKADNLLTNRLVIWTQAADAASHSLMTGQGPSHFFSVVNWQALPDGRTSEWFTYTEHSLVLTWLLSTGMLGFAAFGLAAAVVSLRLLRLARTPTTSLPVRWMISGCVATFVAMLSTWPDPLTILSVSIVASCLMAAAELRPSPTGWTYPLRSRLVIVPTAAVAAVAVFALYSLSPEMTAQYNAARYREPWKHQQLAIALNESYRSTHDPYYLEEILLLAVNDDALAVPKDMQLELVRHLREDFPDNAKPRVDIPALALEVLWRDRDLLSEEELWDLTQFYADKGAAADPDTGIWGFCRARVAYVTRRPGYEEVLERAFDTTQPPSAENLMIAWMATAREQ